MYSLAYYLHRILRRKLRVPVSIIFEGDKGPRQVHSASINYVPFVDTLKIDWDKKDVYIN